MLWPIRTSRSSSETQTLSRETARLETLFEEPRGQRLTQSRSLGFGPIARRPSVVLVGELHVKLVVVVFAELDHHRFVSQGFGPASHGQRRSCGEVPSGLFGSPFERLESQFRNFARGRGRVVWKSRPSRLFLTVAVSLHSACVG